MFKFLADLFCAKSTPPMIARPVITADMVRRANDGLIAGKRSEWPAGIPKPTREDIEMAGRKAMQAHFAREAADGGAFWERDAAFQKKLKNARGEPHLTLVKK